MLIVIIVHNVASVQLPQCGQYSVHLRGTIHTIDNEGVLMGSVSQIALAPTGRILFFSRRVYSIENRFHLIPYNLL